MYEIQCLERSWHDEFFLRKVDLNSRSLTRLTKLFNNYPASCLPTRTLQTCLYLAKTTWRFQSSIAVRPTFEGTLVRFIFTIEAISRVSKLQTKYSQLVFVRLWLRSTGSSSVQCRGKASSQAPFLRSANKQIVGEHRNTALALPSVLHLTLNIPSASVRSSVPAFRSSSALTLSILTHDPVELGKTQ
jgi:hypothetical protein